MISLDIKKLIDCGVHYGHSVSSWCPSMSEYIFGVRKGIHIIDLRYSLALMKRSIEVLKKCASKGGRILFVCTREDASEKVAEAAEKCGQYYVNTRWLGGTFTNWNTISKSIKSMRHIEKLLEDKNNTMTKVEKLVKARKLEKMKKVFEGMKEMGGMADLVCVIGADKDHIAINEAAKSKIPVIAILDTNCSVKNVTYPVPGNDDSIEAINLYLNLWSEAVIEGMSSVSEIKRTQNNSSSSKFHFKSAQALDNKVSTSSNAVASDAVDKNITAKNDSKNAKNNADGNC